jgi:RND family efflux transporter MFP subunit
MIPKLRKFNSENMIRLLKISAALLISTVGSIVITSCSESKEKSDRGNNEPIYEASVVKNAEVAAQLTLPGELEGYYETGIAAKVNGYVKNVLVDIGDRVNSGQLLVELEAPELVSQLATAYSEYQAKEAVYFASRGKFARLRQTNKTPGAVSPYDMDLAKTSMISDSLGFMAAKAKYESVKELTNYLKITAPFDGIITERGVAPGAFVGPADKQDKPIMRLKSEGRLRLHVSVPEKHLAEISVGELVNFHVKSFPSETFQGKITRLSKSLNVLTRSEIIEIEFDNHAGKLLPGMYAISSIPIQRKGKSIVVPKTAIVTNMERQFVIKVRKGSEIAYVNVEKGEDLDKNVEVFGKLQPGDTILNTASDEMKEKSRIKIIVVDDPISNR